MEKNLCLSPRDYQLELFEISKEENVIIKLDTGSGKTFISIMAMNYFLHYTDKQVEDGGKRIVFLVRNVNLVYQQSDSIRNNLAVKKEDVGSYHGEIRPGEWVDLWSEETWKKVFNSHKIIVMTAEVFKNILYHGKYKLDHICLLIFDECHHVAKDDPYKLICKQVAQYHKQSTKYGRNKNNDLPRIIGLTASLINGNLTGTKLVKALQELQENMCSRIITSTLPNSRGSEANENLYKFKQNDFSHFLTLIENVEQQLMDDFNELEYQWEVNNAKMQQSNSDDDDEEDEEEKKKEDQVEKPSDWKIIKTTLKDIKSLKATLTELGEWSCCKVMSDMIQEIEKNLNVVCIDEVEMILNKVIHSLQFIIISSTSTQEFISNKVYLLLNTLVDCHKKMMPIITSPGGDQILHGGGGGKNSSSENLVNYDKILENDLFDFEKLTLLMEKVTEIEAQIDEDYENNENNNQDEPFRALVFVKERQHAFILCVLLKLLVYTEPSVFGFLRPGYITGHSAAQFSTPASCQEKTLAKFRCGRLNLLIATRVVEEGLDVQACNLVIQFDPPMEYRSYIQSKGRARMSNSQYIVLCNQIEQWKVYERFTTFRTIHEQLLQHLDSFSIDAMDVDFDNNSSSSDEEDLQAYHSDLAEVNLQTAMTVLNKYIGQLRSDSIDELKVKIKFIKSSEQGFLAELTLPRPCPVFDVFKSPVLPSRKRAKRHVALQACMKLHEEGELDDYLLPFKRKLSKEDSESDDEIDVVVTKKKSDNYPISFSHELSNRQNEVKSNSTSLYLYGFFCDPNILKSFDFNNQLLNSNSDENLCLALLTGHPIHPAQHVASFPLTLPRGVSVTCSVKLMKKFSTGKSQLEIEKLTAIHKALFHILGSHLQVNWFVETKWNMKKSDLPWILCIADRKLNDISWNISSSLFDAYKDTKFDEKETIALKMSKLPKSQWKGSLMRILDNTDRRPCFIVDFNSSKIQIVRLISLGSSIRKRVLHEKTNKKVEKKSEFVFQEIPMEKLQNCVWIPIPATLFLQLRLFGDMFYRLNQLFLVSELYQSIATFMKWPFNPKDTLILDFSKKSDHQFSLRGLLGALTCQKCHDEDNLELLEVLGDSFLKYITALYLHNLSRPSERESVLASHRKSVICNRNLVKWAIRRNLPRYIFTQTWDCKSCFIPPGFVLNDDDKTDRGKKKIQTKNLADCVESIIGLVLKTHSTEEALKVMCWLEQKDSCSPPDPLKLCQLLLTEINIDFDALYSTIPQAPQPLRNPNKSERQCEILVNKLLQGRNILEETFEYEFNNPLYLLEATTHASDLDNSITNCYQRLEFLGDSILDFLITLIIFDKSLDKSPGYITDLRSALVNNNLFATIVVHHGLHKCLRLHEVKLSQLVSIFNDEVNSKATVNYRDTDFNCNPQMLKVLGDLFESIIGAIFLDSGMSLDITLQSVKPLLMPIIDDFALDVPKNIVRLAYEKFPGLKFGKVEQVVGPKRVILSRMSVTVNGQIFIAEEKNKKLCERSLAKQIVQHAQKE